MTTVVVAGALAAKPGNGGEAWVRLSWVLGLRRLGFDAWLVEEVDRQAAEVGRTFFERTVEEFGLGSRSLLIEAGDAGAQSELEELAGSAVALINISGNLRDAGILDRFSRRAYVDLDPGFTQIWHAQGLLGDQLGRHERHFTVGTNLGGADCTLPPTEFEWIALPPPVLLEEWAPLARPKFDRFTTVATWRNPLGALEAAGVAYTLKHHQIRRFTALPERSGLPFEIALQIDPEEEDEAARLREDGWAVVDPATVTADPHAFRDYVRGSGAEFSVTQGVYAEAHTGWISDRTAHYLASGRPAVVQEAGIPDELRPEAGLLTFSDPEEAVRATEQVVAAYDEHAVAARDYAACTFDSDRVLGRVLEALDVG
jgi:hypothetical protein